MKFSDYVKVMLMDSIRELTAPPATFTPSKAAFYRPQQKLRDDALRALLLAFNKKCSKKLFMDKYSLVACDDSAVDIFRTPNDTDTSYEPNGKSTGDSTSSTSMPCIPSSANSSLT